MKFFSEIRKAKMPSGRHMSSKKIHGIQLMIHFDKGKYITYIDGDKLDAYRSQKEAEKAGLEFIKQYKKR